jgi:hypothetical protein
VQLFRWPLLLIQPLLLVRKRPPRSGHAQERQPGLLVFGALSKEVTVLSVITEYINQIHAGKMDWEERVSTEQVYEMFVILAGCGRRSVRPILFWP